MSKNTFFSGQPIFTQIISLLPNNLVSSLVNELDSDRYYKKFLSKDHVVTMLYATFQKCTSLREVTTGLMACHHKLKHLGLNYTPRRSTLAEANQRRSEVFFDRFYHRLYSYYFKSLPDSRLKGSIENRLFLIDSTTITLFSEVMKGMGVRSVNGRRKGGAKAHMLVKATDDIPCFTMITPAAANDRDIFNKLSLPQNAIVVFDKGYNSYLQFDLWNKAKIHWVTRMNEKSSYEIVDSRIVTDQESAKGVISDQIINLGRTSNKNTTIVQVRKVVYMSPENQKQFTFITNNLRFNPSTIANIYKKRWQIELLFKRLKQNYPLRSFLGESENAIKIQIWCSLITDLLLKIISRKLKKKWSYSNIAAMIRLHLMNYLDLVGFLNNPDKLCLNSINLNGNKQLSLFNRGAPF